MTALPKPQRNVALNASVLPGMVGSGGGRPGAPPPTCRFAEVKALRWGPPGEDVPLLVGPPARPPYDLIVGSDLM